MNDFEIQYEKGERGEEIASTILTHYGWSITDLRDNPASRRADIDYVARRGEVKRTIEIKYSEATARTGNIALELFNVHNGDGWFNYSSAEFIGFVVQSDLHIVPFNELRYYVKAHALPTRRTYDGILMLLPLNEMKNVVGYECLQGEEKWRKDYIA